jgi:uncharacterized membrane protein
VDPVTTPGVPEKQQSLKNLTMVVYALQALAFFNGITLIVGVIINYIKRDEVAGTWLESHFSWQIRTFWWGLLWGVVGFVLTFVLVGFAILFAATIWMIYRIVKGWLKLNEGQPVA